MHRAGSRCTPAGNAYDLVVVDSRAPASSRAICKTGRRRSPTVADAVILATGGYGNAYYLSTNATGCNVTATYRAYKRGALFANPCYTQIHPTCIPVSGDHQSKLTLTTESLATMARSGSQKTGRHAAAGVKSPKTNATTTWSGSIRASATSSRATSPRAAKEARRGSRRRHPEALAVPRFRRRHQTIWARTRWSRSTATSSRCTKDHGEKNWP